MEAASGRQKSALPSFVSLSVAGEEGRKEERKNIIVSSSSSSIGTHLETGSSRAVLSLCQPSINQLSGRTQTRTLSLSLSSSQNFPGPSFPVASFLPRVAH
mmetsp:Transcript_21922/g.53778  ORF Transcript_21922/g.53778 Transcript_21922/m.53778 type:complete len:101 (+) Transcript_21922:224-526(+)